MKIKLEPPCKSASKTGIFECGVHVWKGGWGDLNLSPMALCQAFDLLLVFSVKVF